MLLHERHEGQCIEKALGTLYHSRHTKLTSNNQINSQGGPRQYTYTTPEFSSQGVFSQWGQLPKYRSTPRRSNTPYSSKKLQVTQGKTMPCAVAIGPIQHFHTTTRR